MKEQIILTGSCYWCLEALFKKIKGVIAVIPGLYDISDYPFAFTKNDKIEAIKITFDKSIISYSEIFDVLFLSHNPTLIKWEFEDCFYPKCRSSVFYFNEEQKEAIEQKIIQLSSLYSEKVQTKIAFIKPDNFTLASEKDRDYYFKNPNDGYCTSIIKPKIEKLNSDLNHLVIDENFNTIE
jgi:peptide-methionine (S)-S-oxide reductase